MGSAAIGARARETNRTVLVLDDAGSEPLEMLLGAPMDMGRFLRLGRRRASADGLPESAVPSIADVLLLQRNDAKGPQRTFVFTDPAARARPDEEAQFHIAE